MTRKLTLKLLAPDVERFNEAARNIAGAEGAPYVGRMVVIRQALDAFNESHSKAAMASSTAA